MDNSELTIEREERFTSKLAAATDHERLLFVIDCKKAAENRDKLHVLHREKYILEKRGGEYSHRISKGLIGLVGYIIASYIFGLWSDYSTNTLTMSFGLLLVGWWGMHFILLQITQQQIQLLDERVDRAERQDHYPIFSHDEEGALELEMKMFEGIRKTLRA